MACTQKHQCLGKTRRFIWNVHNQVFYSQVSQKINYDSCVAKLDLTWGKALDLHHFFITGGVVFFFFFSFLENYPYLSGVQLKGWPLISFWAEGMKYHSKHLGFHGSPSGVCAYLGPGSPACLSSCFLPLQHTVCSQQSQWPFQKEQDFVQYKTIRKKNEQNPIN